MCLSQQRNPNEIARKQISKGQGEGREFQKEQNVILETRGSWH